jgi:hypothetical protein
LSTSGNTSSHGPRLTSESARAMTAEEARGQAVRGALHLDSWPMLQRRRLLAPAVQGIALSWLAAVESTQSPDRIREALRKLETLPSPDAITKKAPVALLVANGYPLLREASK